MILKGQAVCHLLATGDLGHRRPRQLTRLLNVQSNLVLFSVCYEVQLEDWRFARRQRNGIRGDWIFRSICEVPCLYATIKLLRQQDSVVFGCSCFSSLSPRRPSDIHHTLFKFMGPSLRRTATGRVIVRVRVRVYDARACFCKVEPALRDPAHEHPHFFFVAHIPGGSWPKHIT